MTFVNMQMLFTSSMANPISFCNHTKKQRCLPSLVRVFVFLSSLNFFIFSKASATKCTLDFQFPLFNDTGSTSEDETWSGFLSNHCGAAFESYLYALANRANRTGQIFLIQEEQKDCLISLRNSDSDASDCGLEKLTGGNGGCSDYNIADVAEKLETKTNNLSQDCKFPDSENYDEICSKCTKRWIEIASSSDNGNEVEKNEAMVCRFAVLVRLTSNRIDDPDWIHNLYTCLGNYSLSSDEGPGHNGIDVNKSTGLWVVCGGIVGIVVVILIAAWTLWGRKIHPRFSGPTKVLHRSSSLSSGCMKMTAQEIHLATNNLDPLNFIGQGVAGLVYKGRLSNGQHVAVKHIINDGQQETFIREVKSLAHIRHPNLVNLIGYYGGKDQYFLVYELCRHGNLSDWLFGKDRNLSWIQRLKIAIDSARGLLFLHNYHEGCIVHRDIKPANILIGANFQAKLSDFGLSKVMNIGQSFVSSEVRGTFGYIDPEYRQNHHVKAAGDVYSFGIVLLQLLSGKRVINLNMKRPMPLDKIARCFTPGKDSTEFADPKLDGDYPTEAFGIVLNLALSCTGLKNQRPSMEEVMFKLEMALKISREGGSFTFSTSVMA